MVYSAAKKNPSLTLEWTKHPEVGLPLPDAVVFLNLSPEEAAKRGGYGEEKYETQEMQTSVRKLFFELEKSHGDEADMITIDAGASIDEVHERIMACLKELLKAVTEGGMGREIRKVNPW